MTHDRCNQIGVRRIATRVSGRSLSEVFVVALNAIPADVPYERMMNSTNVRLSELKRRHGDGPGRTSTIRRYLLTSY